MKKTILNYLVMVALALGAVVAPVLTGCACFGAVNAVALAVLTANNWENFKWRR